MSRKNDNVSPPASDLNMELLGVSSLNSFKRFNSSAREAMMANHLGQSPVVKGSEQRRIFTGAEAEYGKYTFTVKFPVDCKVLKVMRKFQRGLGDWSIKENPTTYVLYEAYDDPMRTIGVLEIPSFAHYHKDFGFEMVKRRDVWERIREGEMISKDEIIASSIALSKDGEYGFGVNAEVAAVSVPSTIEDGFLVSRQFLERLETKGYHKLSADWGKSYFPLNLYGDDTHYKPFPDVGERIRPDGLVFALREMDGHESMMDITPKATRTVDYAFDKLIYGKPNAKVADITVYHDTDIDHPKTPLGMEEQAANYYNAEAEFYKEVIRTYRDLNRRREGRLKITPEFNQLVIRALTFLPSEEKRKLTRMYRLDKLDEYRVDLTYEYTLRPNNGFKGTSTDGGKGVFCKIVDETEMPIDELGRRAEVAIYGGSTMKRMNIGKAYEQFLNAASRDLVHRFRQEIGLDPLKSHDEKVVRNALASSGKTENQAQRLMGYYAITSPRMVAMLSDDAASHLVEVLKDGIYLYFPPDNPVDGLDMARKLKNSEYCPHYGPVTYVNQVGDTVETKANVLIGKLYFILLEKTTQEWSSVASVKLQYLGIPGRLNNNDKHGTPGREQSVRALGEAEVRGWLGAVDPEAVVELLDQSNNPISHRAVLRNFMTADKPTNIPRAVDRKEIPFGGSRPVMLVNNFMSCLGVKFTHVNKEE